MDHGSNIFFGRISLYIRLRDKIYGNVVLNEFHFDFVRNEITRYLRLKRGKRIRGERPVVKSVFQKHSVQSFFARNLSRYEISANLRSVLTPQMFSFNGSIYARSY